MWEVKVVCSSCEEESEVLVEELDDIEREACPCGYSYVVLSVGVFTPVQARTARVIELPRRRRLDRAA